MFNSAARLLHLPHFLKAWMASLKVDDSGGTSKDLRINSFSASPPGLYETRSWHMIAIAERRFEEIISSLWVSGTAIRSMVEARFSSLAHRGLARSELGFGERLMRSRGCSRRCSWYHSVDSSIRSFHHSWELPVRSLITGSIREIQSLRSIGPVVGFHSTKLGKVGLPRTNSVPCSLSSSLPSMNFFCIACIPSMRRSITWKAVAWLSIEGSACCRGGSAWSGVENPFGCCWCGSWDEPSTSASVFGGLAASFEISASFGGLAASFGGLGASRLGASASFTTWAASWEVIPALSKNWIMSSGGLSASLWETSASFGGLAASLGGLPTSPVDLSASFGVENFDSLPCFWTSKSSIFFRSSLFSFTNASTWDLRGSWSGSWDGRGMKPPCSWIVGTPWNLISSCSKNSGLWSGGMPNSDGLCA